MFRGFVGAAACAAAIAMFGANSARAADNWILSFSGSMPLGLEIGNLTTNPYVEGFYIPGAITARAPFEPDSLSNENDIAILSTVDVSPTGGNIRIFSSPMYDAFYDGSIFFNLSYTLSNPHALGSKFSDAVTGTAHITSDLEMPDGSLPESMQDFTLTSLSAEVPEPSTWAMMLVGIFSLGAVLRATRHTRRVQPLLSVEA